MNAATERDPGSAPMSDSGSGPGRSSETGLAAYLASVGLNLIAYDKRVAQDTFQLSSQRPASSRGGVATTIECRSVVR